jgi:hypothetical protein
MVKMKTMLTGVVEVVTAATTGRSKERRKEHVLVLWM